METDYLLDQEENEINDAFIEEKFTRAPEAKYFISNLEDKIECILQQDK